MSENMRYKQLHPSTDSHTVGFGTDDGTPESTTPTFEHHQCYKRPRANRSADGGAQTNNGRTNGRADGGGSINKQHKCYHECPNVNGNERTNDGSTDNSTDGLQGR